MINKIFTTIFTDKLDEIREFYTKYLNGKITFDCGWFITIRFASDDTLLNFMTPQEDDHEIFPGKGLTIDMRVDNVEEFYNGLIQKGLEIKSEIEEHSWGDKAFLISDPCGLRLYIYEDTEIGDEYKDAIVK